MLFYFPIYPNYHHGANQYDNLEATLVCHLVVHGSITDPGNSGEYCSFFFLSPTHITGHIRSLLVQLI